MNRHSDDEKAAYTISVVYGWAEVVMWFRQLFHSAFSIVTNRQIDQQIDQPSDGPTERAMDRLRDKPTDGQLD